MPKFLVTGATGQIGGKVARQLLAKGHDVRALVRDASKPSAKALETLGAELSVGDYGTPETLVAAASGVDAVFILTSPNGGIEAETRGGVAMADAAKQAGVGHLVLNSVADAQHETGIPHFESKQRIEEHLQSLGVPYTVVAPVYYYTNLLWSAQAIAEGTWRIALPGERKLQMISPDDIAAFAVHVLEHPREFADRHIDIAADELSPREMAAALSEATGGAVRFERQPLAEVREYTNEDMGLMFEWFDTTGYSVRIPELAAEYPEIPWTPFADWAKAQSWGARA